MEKADPQRKFFQTFAINFVCGTVNLSEDEQKQSFKKFIDESKKKKSTYIPTKNNEVGCGGGGCQTPK